QIGTEIKRSRLDAATTLASGWPRRQTSPDVRSCLKRRHRRDVSFGRIILKVLCQKRPENILAEIHRCVVAEPEGSKVAAVANLLSVMPGTHHEKNLVIVCVFRLDCLVHRRRTVNVFLIPKTVYEHDGNLQRQCRQ